ncbi:MAG: CHAP domain-containing protein [Bacillota bacterium]|nr:CHAP domain-containing protein [Bacillota bacterium]
MDSYRSVPVYYNNLDNTDDKRETFSSDGYYYGLKWQCVEYVKRFYYDAKGHKMPNVFGDAKDFFDPSVPQGGLNQQRGLVQYKNGGTEKPNPDDILVFTNPPYGHVAIVTKVTSDTVEVIQQNRKNSRQVFALIEKNHRYFVGTSSKPVGWLRKE